MQDIAIKPNINPSDVIIISDGLLKRGTEGWPNNDNNPVGIEKPVKQIEVKADDTFSSWIIIFFDSISCISCAFDWK